MWGLRLPASGCGKWGLRLPASGCGMWGLWPQEMAVVCGAYGHLHPAVVCGAFGHLHPAVVCGAFGYHGEPDRRLCACKPAPGACRDLCALLSTFSFLLLYSRRTSVGEIRPRLAKPPIPRSLRYCQSNVARDCVFPCERCAEGVGLRSVTLAPARRQMDTVCSNHVRATATDHSGG